MKAHLRPFAVGLSLVAVLLACDSGSGDDLDPRGVYRIELQWDESPDDLDAHLTGPDGVGGRFHVYFGNLIVDGHELEDDHTDGPGPEILRMEPDARDGMYRFSVHNFSDQSASGAQGMVDLNAEVRLIEDGRTIRTFEAPPATSGNTWRVFEMEIDGDDVTITPSSGSDGIGYFTADDSGDVGVFLTSETGAPVAKE
jgi:hypothetical protein